MTVAGVVTGFVASGMYSSSAFLNGCRSSQTCGPLLVVGSTLSVSLLVVGPGLLYWGLGERKTRALAGLDVQASPHGAFVTWGRAFRAEP